MKCYYRTFWGDNKPQKRYVLLFNTYNDNYKLSKSCSEFDNINDCLEEAKELDLLYKTHKLPLKEKKIESYKNSWGNIIEKVKTIYNYSNKRSWWGYMILDMEECKCLKIGGYGYRLNTGKKADYADSRMLYIVERPRQINSVPYLIDYFFRDTNICPDDYLFECHEEYEGWLQFKYGDGKNAINYVKPQKQKSNKPKEEDKDIEGLKEYFDETYAEETLIEQKFSDLIDKETQNRLMEKYGW